jgi:hypothetical protein
MPADMTAVDLALAYDWDYDADFIRLCREDAERRGLATLTVSSSSLAEALASVASGGLAARFLLDRASSTSPEFLPFQKALVERGADVIDPVERLRWASDKATMHLEFITAGLVTPYTVILPPLSREEEIVVRAAELERLGRPFVIKPANTTGGSLGVIKGAAAFEDILRARREFREDKYLVQETVRPLERHGRRFWFRGFYSCGLVQCAWWDDLTHRYGELAADEVESYGLLPLYEIVSRIAGVCRLRFFSTEIALGRDGRFVVIDYVNEACDVRLQSSAVDGVPDALVRNIAASIVRYVGDRPGPPPREAGRDAGGPAERNRT